VLGHTGLENTCNVVWWINALGSEKREEVKRMEEV
jgi:hypothetical protein